MNDYWWISKKTIKNTIMVVMKYFEFNRVLLLDIYDIIKAI